MKIGFFVADIAIPRGFDDGTSAHVQIPLHCLRLLREAGHTVELITTQVAAGEVMPKHLPAGTVVHQVVDPVRRHAGKSRLRPLKLVQHLRQIKAIVRRERYDVLHFHGFRSTPDLAALLILAGVDTPVVATVNDSDLPGRGWLLRKRLWQRVSAFVTSTEFVGERLRACGIPAAVIRHGSVRDIRAELTAPVAAATSRVLFWRDPSLANGVDVCLAAYRALAPRFPHISFDAAVRAHREDWIGEFQQLARQHGNVRLHVFPYVNGVSLAQLLAESVCVLLPFRTLSYHPQLAVLESIQFGATVITTALDSNVELADQGHDAVVVPVGDIDATISAIAAVLENPHRANEFAQRAARNVQARWNWDAYVPQIVQKYREATGQA